MIGGAESYLPVCRECYIVKTKEQEQAKQTAKNKLTEISFDDDKEYKLLSVQKSDHSEKTNASSAAASNSSPMIMTYKEDNEEQKVDDTKPFSADQE